MTFSCIACRLRFLSSLTQIRLLIAVKQLFQQLFFGKITLFQLQRHRINSTNLSTVNHIETSIVLLRFCILPIGIFLVTLDGISLLIFMPRKMFVAAKMYFYFLAVRLRCLKSDRMGRNRKKCWRLKE